MSPDSSLESSSDCDAAVMMIPELFREYDGDSAAALCCDCGGSLIPKSSSKSSSLLDKLRSEY